MLDIDPELIATALEKNDGYRVLRRHKPRRLFDDAGDAPIQNGLILDIEATGLDHNFHEIIEIGLVPFTYTMDGRLIASGDPYGSFQQPFGPILPEITRLTGIDLAMVEGHMIDRPRVTHIKRHPELTPSRHEDLTPMLISHA